MKNVFKMLFFLISCFYGLCAVVKQPEKVKIPVDRLCPLANSVLYEMNTI
jgi:Na+-transporting methylmalonyl-CoA/oxaloacetate decarboxylase gamma subunit